MKVAHECFTRSTCELSHPVFRAIICMLAMKIATLEAAVRETFFTCRQFPAGVQVLILLNTKVLKDILYHKMISNVAVTRLFRKVIYTYLCPATPHILGQGLSQE